MEIGFNRHGYTDEQLGATPAGYAQWKAQKGGASSGRNDFAAFGTSYEDYIGELGHAKKLVEDPAYKEAWRTRPGQSSSNFFDRIGEYGQDFLDISGDAVQGGIDTVKAAGPDALRLAALAVGGNYLAGGSLTGAPGVGAAIDTTIPTIGTIGDAAPVVDGLSIGGGGGLGGTGGNALSIGGSTVAPTLLNGVDSIPTLGGPNTITSPISVPGLDGSPTTIPGTPTIPGGTPDSGTPTIPGGTPDTDFWSGFGDDFDWRDLAILGSGLYSDYQSGESHDAATEEISRQFDISQENLAPWQEAGVNALDKLTNFDTDSITNDPMYQHQLGEALRGTERGASARGFNLSTNALNDIATTAANTSSNWGEQQKNDLRSLAGLGQVALNTGIDLGTNTANTLAGFDLSRGSDRNNAVQGTLSNWLTRDYMQNPPGNPWKDYFDMWRP